MPAAVLVLVPTVFSLEYFTLIPCVGAFLLIMIFVEGHASILFSAAPVDMQGRLWSLISLITSLPLALAPTIAGWMLDSIGYTPAVSSFILLSFVTGASWILMPGVRSLPKPDQWDTIEL
ncbi:hypothetical protein JTE88_05330 [Arcanobacterium phocisimile]|uniref:Major Facilitator Superfamily protein n=1 Tax=Arcanobacterium phocisimile TaxID=1302235 RepID=A0ABX7IEH0_9ACTO|nr:hypothetical protein [Arcanobacterium phocisimile]QRV01536.1 hypothetical protein JTE88_05330 [Arcanobacterium phocisimile]